MSILDDCEHLFGTRELYEVLSISKDASEKEVKKAYHKLSLKVHPDRVAENGKLDATKKFQVLSMVYCILSDKEKKAVYDETGTIDDENTLSDDRDWQEYWRLLFPKITLNDIKKYMEKYKGSKEELDDLKVYYTRFEGNLNKMSEYMPGYDVEDEGRYKEILKSLITNKAVPSFAKFTKETAAQSAKRKKKYVGEASEAESMRKEMGMDNDSDDALVKAITKRQAVRQSSFDSLLSSLEEKYAKPKGVRNRKSNC